MEREGEGWRERERERDRDPQQSFDLMFVDEEGTIADVHTASIASDRHDNAHSCNSPAVKWTNVRGG